MKNESFYRIADRLRIHEVDFDQNHCSLQCDIHFEDGCTEEQICLSISMEHLHNLLCKNEMKGALLLDEIDFKKSYSQDFCNVDVKNILGKSLLTKPFKMLIYPADDEYQDDQQVYFLEQLIGYNILGRFPEYAKTEWITNNRKVYTFYLN